VCLLNYSNLWIAFVSGEKQWAYIFKRGALKSACERESADAAAAQADPAPCQPHAAGATPADAAGATPADAAGATPADAAGATPADAAGATPADAAGATPADAAGATPADAAGATPADAAGATTKQSPSDKLISEFIAGILKKARNDGK